ncbi:MAG: copper amine oxidase N-terminal domain-containing protein [Oscillospiraceae bacterium]|nr:copper amine oxidase N-terminal domain-containing protein [Oscillospiraceae bacterium]
MLNFKKISLLLLTLLLVLSFAACADTESVPPPTPEPTPTPIEEPDYEEDEEEDNGYELPDIDWGEYAVIVDGVGVPGASLETVGDSIFPTHVSLLAVAERGFGLDVFWNVQTDEVFFPGLNGNIHFFGGSADFDVDGETITLNQESLRIGDEIYVPILFFRDVFGAGSAYFSGGIVSINTEGGDME